MFHFFVFNLDKNQLFIYSIFSEEYSYTFTRFPLKNSEVLVKWENAIKKYDRQGNNWKATQFSRICSKHFLKTDFTNDANRWEEMYKKTDSFRKHVQRNHKQELCDE